MSGAARHTAGVLASKLFGEEEEELDFRGRLTFVEHTLRLCRVVGSGMTAIKSLTLGGPLNSECLQLLVVGVKGSAHLTRLDMR